MAKTVKLSKTDADGTERFRETGSETAQRYLDAGWALVEGDPGEAEETADPGDEDATGGTKTKASTAKNTGD